MILLARLSAIPGTPLEAVLVDCTPPREMLQCVTLPLLQPIILVALLLRTVDALKMLDVAFALKRRGPADATELLWVDVHGIEFYQIGMVGSGLRYGGVAARGHGRP